MYTRAGLVFVEGDRFAFMHKIDLMSIDFLLKAFVATGTNLSLQFFPASWQGEPRQAPTRDYVDFERESSKVSCRPDVF